MIAARLAQVIGSLVLGVGVALVGIQAAPAEALPPAAATLVSPAGLVVGSGHTFAWQAVGSATFYYLLVNDATASPRLALWFPAGQACPAGTATCLVTLSADFAAGSGTWWIQTWNPDGFGPWSAGMGFTVRWVGGAWEQSLPAAERFQLVMAGNAVLDRETGLVWERIPVTSALTWTQASGQCYHRVIDIRRGWRLPSLQELSSLIDTTQNDPALPPGHPFGSIGNVKYWTSVDAAGNSASAHTVDLSAGFPFVDAKTSTLRVWCVRGGAGRDVQ
jgi:hypothetical protein